MLGGNARGYRFRASTEQNGYAGIRDRVVIHCHSLN
jgi:hypothetical protein